MSDRYILDTDVLSNFAKARPCPELLQWHQGISPHRLSICISSIFEIQRGIELARPTHPELAALKEVWLDGLIASGIQMLPMGAPAARLKAKMTTTPALKGFLATSSPSRLKFAEDLTIAATAIVTGSSIVTFNVKDFVAIHAHYPLPGIYHPGRGQWTGRTDVSAPSLGRGISSLGRTERRPTLPSYSILQTCFL